MIEARQQQAEHEAAVTAAAQEYLSGHAVIRAFGLRSAIQEAFRRDLQEPPGVTERAGRLLRLLRTATSTGVVFTSFAVTALSIVFVSQGSLSIGSLVGFLGTLAPLGQSASRLSDVFPDWLSMGPSLARIDEVLGELQ